MKLLSLCKVALLVSLVATTSAGAATSAMTLNVTREAVTVSNVPAGASIVLFSCARIAAHRSIAVRPGAMVLQDEKREGTIRYSPAAGVPLRSVWIAVDPESGQIATGAVADFPISVTPLGDSSFKRDTEGELASMAVELPRLLVLLVSPKKGAWILKAFDGEPADHDGHSNGRIELSFADCTTLYGSDRSPKHLKKDDVVIAIDPGHLDVFTALIGK